jgi:hypothetical protein
VLSTAISPPSSRAISRLIESPSPVPPYLRLVVPSACWKASKMSRCLSFGIPIPVSRTEKPTTERAVMSAGSEKRIVGSGGWMTRVTDPRSVNLKALARRFFNTCCRRCGSVMMPSGAFSSMTAPNSSPF